MEDLEEIKKIVEPIVKNNGLEIFDITLNRERGKLSLRIFIDKLTGNVTLDECESISNLISQALDEENIGSQSYNLEVSSPGLDRPLRNIDDFIRFKNNLVKLNLSAPVASIPFSSTNIITRIKDVKDDYITLEDEQGRIFDIKYGQIVKARLKVEI